MELKVYRTPVGPVVSADERSFRLENRDWDDLFRDPDVVATLAGAVRDAREIGGDELARLERLPPVQSQEVWAAGVTYRRSRSARMEESADAGGASFYDRVYEADRPELFFKASPHRVVASGAPLRLRRDSAWIVPEPELTLAISSRGTIFGYTVGNDLSCRDIEGENPLYLPQAKTFDGCAALGPGIRITSDPLPPSTAIHIEILRDGDVVFADSIAIDQMKRSPESLVEHLFREASFPAGCFLMTGTGIVPPDGFSLTPGDEVAIRIDGIGEIRNPLERA